MKEIISGIKDKVEEMASQSKKMLNLKNSCHKHSWNQRHYKTSKSMHNKDIESEGNKGQRHGK